MAKPTLSSLLREQPDQEAAYRMWCAEQGLDPEDAESAVVFEEDWREGFNRPMEAAT